MAQGADGGRDVAVWFFPGELHDKDAAGRQAVERDTHENGRHRTYFIGDVDNCNRFFRQIQTSSQLT
ncbi:hypothetical protein Amme_056_013 [Acidomonas methanolica NBRC 104435]|uniref:Uncharacterized protein n=1 Tax=Acidomonas methanolica NBRC 104435 TaxID=1231351 RepID=A0A023D534_ACIMT|nr:hypothetical protein Amme_056_013 [Acidomonas methanolica NBRC 104435]